MSSIARQLRGKLALVAIMSTALTASAAANPLFFLPAPQTDAPLPLQAPAVSDDREEATPARFKRQIVDYPTREAAGTIIIDTPNTYLYFVLGGGRALRYGI